MRKWFIVIMAILFAAPGYAQQSDAVTIDALRMKTGQLQQMLDQTLLGLAESKQMREAADGRAKWIWDNWVPKEAKP